MRQLFLTLFLLYTCIGFASVYMEQDNGTITYSDTPTTNSKKIFVPSSSNNTVPSFAPVSVNTAPLPIASAADNNASYKTFSILSPKEGETFQNQPTIAVKIKIEPELRKTDKIQLLLDNKPWGDALASTELSLTNIERGTHQVYAVILDNNQKILEKSNAVTIYVHKTSTNFRPS